MGKKPDAAVTVLCLGLMVVLPVVRSGELPRIWEGITHIELAGLGLRGVLGLLILGVQAVPAFWFSCFSRHYVTNLLILALLAFLVVMVRKFIQRKTENQKEPKWRRGEKL